MINCNYETEETSLQQADKAIVVAWSIVCSFLEKEKKLYCLEIL